MTDAYDPGSRAPAGPLRHTAAGRLACTTCSGRAGRSRRCGRSSRRRRCSSSPPPTGHGHPQCSYKGGAPGFVQILAPMELCFPSYDGNGMYLSTGNIMDNPSIQLLFIDFEQPNRVRVSGQATISDDPALVGRYPGAQFAVHVAVTTCSRTARATSTAPPSHELSPNVPDADGRGTDRRVEVHARVQRRARRRRPGPCGDLTAVAPGVPRPRRDGRRRRLLVRRRRHRAERRRRRRPPDPTTTRRHERRHHHGRRRRRPPRRRRARRRPRRCPADPFLLGVSSGDPDATSVVLWTRLVGELARRRRRDAGSSPRTTRSPTSSRPAP